MRNGMYSKAKWLPALWAATLLSLSTAGCGEGKDTVFPVSSSAPLTATAPATIASHPTSHHGYLNDGDNDVIGDADNDNSHDNDHDNSEDHVPNDNGSYQDSDDSSILAYGHAANGADKRTITAVVKRYYAAAATGDGAKACAMLAPKFAESVAEDYGRGSTGPSYLQGGTTCPAVMMLLFQHSHAEVADPFDVTGVRLGDNHAYALLGSRVTVASYITLERRRGAWRIGALIGLTLP